MLKRPAKGLSSALTDVAKPRIEQCEDEIFPALVFTFSIGVDPVSVRHSRPSFSKCTVNTASVVPS